MIIEIFGLPGAGKTSFVRALVKDDEKYENVKVTSRLELLSFNLLYFLRHPKKFVAFLFLVVRYGGSLQLMYSKFMNLFLQYNARFIKAKLSDLALLDQGHIISVLSLFEKNVTTETMKSVYNNIAKPDILVVLEASDKIRHGRLEERGYGVRYDISEEYGKSFLNVMADNYLEAKNIINDDKNLKKIIINTDSLSSEQIVKSFKKSIVL